MIVYGGQEEKVDASERFSQVQNLLLSCANDSSNHDLISELLIEWGVFESAVADAASPDHDSDPPLLQRLRQAGLLIGHLFCLSVQRQTTEMPHRIEQLGRLLQDPLFRALPRQLTLRVPEGYAYYALIPETYLQSAFRFFQEVGARPMVAIGIRSIGTSLSAVVGAALEAAGCPVCSFTVRPRGHPFNRSLRLAPSLEAALSKKRGSYFLIVDEGPGLSGSSMTSVAEKLCGLGIAEDRIVFFPSWEPDGSGFRSEAARRRWPRHRKITTSFEQRFLSPGRDRLTDRPLFDLSGGQWRSLFYRGEADPPAVHPQHERRKYLTLESESAFSPGGILDATAFQKDKPHLLKFVGLGRYGRLKRERAERLADAGWGPPAVGLAKGFLITEFVEGTPVDGAKVDSALIETMARYLAYLHKTFPATRRRSFDEMMEMIRINITEGMGGGWCGRIDRLERFRSGFEAGRPIALDGRMLPHEWLKTARGYLKADGLDHHNDHFFPGCQEVAWDLAGSCVEFAFSPLEEEGFLRRYQALAKDRDLFDRFPFYKVAYLAYRLGYVSLAAETLGASPDGARFRALSDRYRSLLIVALSREFSEAV